MWELWTCPVGWTAGLSSPGQLAYCWMRLLFLSPTGEAVSLELCGAGLSSSWFFTLLSLCTVQLPSHIWGFFKDFPFVLFICLFLSWHFTPLGHRTASGLPSCPEALCCFSKVRIGLPGIARKGTKDSPEHLWAWEMVPDFWWLGQLSGTEELLIQRRMTTHVTPGNQTSCSTCSCQLSARVTQDSP